MRAGPLAAGDVLLIACLVAVLLFMVLYHWTAKWEKSAMGRHLMGMSAALFLVLGQSLATILMGTDFWGRPVTRAVVYLVLLGVILAQARLLVKAQSDARRSALDKEKESWQTVPKKRK